MMVSGGCFVAVNVLDYETKHQHWRAFSGIFAWKRPWNGDSV